MTSIHTNISALRSLSTLREITSSLAETRTAATSGLRISTAKDNAAYWAIGTRLRGDIATRSVVSDALNLSQAIVDTAYEGVNRVIGIMSQMREKFATAINASNEDRAKLELEVVALREAFLSVIRGSSFAGQNWLSREKNSDSTSRSLVTGVVRNSNGTVSVKKTVVDLRTVLLIDTAPATGPAILTKAYSATDGTSDPFVYTRYAYRPSGTVLISVVSAAGTVPATATSRIKAGVRMIDMMLNDLTTVGSTLGALRKGISDQADMNQAYGDVETRSLGRLVDAEMGDTAARLRALETRQQMAVHNLNLANARTESLLALFRTPFNNMEGR